MNKVSQSFRGIVWFMLCVIMALGMLIFAMIFAVFTFIFKKISWKELTFPLVKLAK